MKLLIIAAEDGDGLALAERAAEAGHRVRYWASSNPATGDGFEGVEKVANWVASVSWADVVLPTGSGRFLERLDAFRERGIRVYGPTAESAKLERPNEVPSGASGARMTVSRWVGSGGFIGRFNEGFPYTRLMPGDLGPETSGQGSVQRYVEESALGKEMLTPIEQTLIDMGHLGLITARCAIDDEGKAHLIGFTCHPAFPEFSVMQVEHEGDPVEWMLAACKGEDAMKTGHDIACGVMVSQPDATAGVPIELTDKTRQYFEPRAVKQDAHRLLTTGASLGVLTGTGRNVRQATQRAYRTLQNLHVPDMMYRNDIGESLDDVLTKLQPHGYATDWSY